MSRISTTIVAATVLITFACAQERSLPNTEIAPKTSVEWYANGVSALENHSYEKAAASLKACVNLDKGNIPCYWELGWAYYMLGNWQASSEAWKIVEAHQPNFPGLLSASTELRDIQSILASAMELYSTSATSFPIRTTGLLHIRAVGDTMLGSDYPRPLIPAQSPLIHVQTILRNADLTFANLEGPVCDGGTTQKCKFGQSCYAFRTPRSLLPWFTNAGFDLVSLANNHSLDFGSQCLEQTENGLADHNIAHSGRPGSFARIRKRGLIIAMVAFHSSENTNDMRDIATAKELVGAIANDADITIVSFHGGAEGRQALRIPIGKPEIYLGENRGNVTEFARAMVDVGADLVIGHGPHVPRAIEIYHKRLIAYSLGNFATYGYFSLAGFSSFGLVLDVALDRKGKFVGGRILPTRQVNRGVPLLDPDANSVNLVRYLSQNDFPANAVRIAQDGTLATPRPVKPQ